MTARGFSDAEYEVRLARAQTMMADAGLAALLLTTEPEFRYFSGFLTRFWESPSRPWFLIVPATGKPVAVIPSIGVPLMRRGWVEDIRSWRAPDLVDDGVGLLAETLAEHCPASASIGVPSNMESHVRMPLADFQRLQKFLEPRRLTGDNDILRKLRLIKSSAEVAKIRTACGVADRAFVRVTEIAAEGVPLETVFRKFQALCLKEGADWVPYLAGASESGGYSDVISLAKDAPLADGDVLMLDTGAIFDGYFCDFDRNFSVGKPTAIVQSSHAKLIEATHAALQIARPGATGADLFHAMDKIVTDGAGGSDAGRLGHGLGMQLTEWPSLIPQDETVLEAGMVLTLEPGIETGNGKMMVHEENIVITENGAEFLSTPAKAEIAVI